jgi:hypothetical protein
MARTDEQLINRRVYTDKGELLREGLVPLSIKNERAALMQFWQAEDQRVAAEEAAAAQAAVEELQAPVVPDAAELVAPLVDRLAAVEGRLGVVDQLAVATPEAVLTGTMAISRAAGAAALVEAATATTLNQLDGAVKAADARLAGIEGTVGQTAAAVGELLADVRASAETAEAQRDAKLATAISKRVTGLEVAAAQLRGPKGDRGRIGQGLIAGAGKRPEVRPDGSEWAPGDSWLDTKSEGFQLIYMDADGSWSKPARMVPAPKLINATVNTLDMAPRTSVTMPAAPSTGEGGSADNLKTVVQSQGGWNRLTSLDRYAALGYSGIAKSALISVEATIIDGPHSGRTGTWLISAALDKVGVCNVEIYAELGEIPRDFGVAPSVEIRTTGTFQKPPAVIGTFPAAPSIECFCNGWLEPASGWAGRPNQLLIRGWIKWNTDSRIVGITPAWTLAQEYS